MRSTTITPKVAPASEHPSQSANRTSNGTPRYPRLLTPFEASFLSQEPVERLLQDGETGALTFFVRVPAGARVQLYNDRTGECADPPLMRIPNIIALDGEACTELIAWKRAQLRRASVGAILSPSERGGDLRIVKPADCDDPEPSNPRYEQGFRLARWTHWKVTLSHAAPLEVGIEDVRVFQLDLERRFELSLEPYGKSEFMDVGGNPQVRENYKSDLLQYANQAARKFWGPQVDPNDTSTYPDTKVIVQWLRSRDAGLSESLATNIASVIRPEWAPSTRVSKEPKDFREAPRIRKTRKA